MPPEGSSSRESRGISRIPSWAAAHGRSSASLLLVLVAGRHLRRSGPSHICWDGGAPFDLQDFPNQKQRRCARASKRCRVASLSVADIRLVNLPKLLSLIIGTHFPTTRKLNRPSQYFLNSNITSYHIASLHFARERETGSPLKIEGDRHRSAVAASASRASPHSFKGQRIMNRETSLTSRRTPSLPCMIRLYFGEKKPKHGARSKEK